ncbi:hypothetical protein QBC39DRAFT_332940 [Podospora conica]|nr:hypothetical protein QBC39DRAFT_332940 [Schizothecium conicum]
MSAPTTKTTQHPVGPKTYEEDLGHQEEHELRDDNIHHPVKDSLFPRLAKAAPQTRRRPSCRWALDDGLHPDHPPCPTLDSRSIISNPTSALSLMLAWCLYGWDLKQLLELHGNSTPHQRRWSCWLGESLTQVGETTTGQKDFEVLVKMSPISPTCPAPCWSRPSPHAVPQGPSSAATRPVPESISGHTHGGGLTSPESRPSRSTSTTKMDCPWRAAARSTLPPPEKPQADPKSEDRQHAAVYPSTGHDLHLTHTNAFLWPPAGIPDVEGCGSVQLSIHWQDWRPELQIEYHDRCHGSRLVV